MVFQILGKMVIDGLDHGKRAKLSQTQTLNWDFSRHLQQFSPSLKPVFATIAKFQWFSGVPSQLNGWTQPLETMVFRWFLGHATIGNGGFRCLSTIGPTMEWLSTIEQV